MMRRARVTFSLVRQLIDHFSEIPNSLPLQVEVCKELITWTVEENRFFLKQSLETRLAALYLDNRMYSDALSLIATLLKELKRLDDKLVLMEVQLLESRTYHALRNLPKARVSFKYKLKDLILHEGCSHFCSYLGQCHLLSAHAPSRLGFAVWHFTCGRQGL